jgi:uncharacterized membrane protein
LTQQVLDRLYLNDKQAIVVIAAMVIGSFINIPLYRGTPTVSINLGGGLIPLGLAIYVLSRAGTSRERIRGILGAVISGAVLFGVSQIYKFDTRVGFIDPKYLWGILAGLVAYIIGRSRRLAFIGGVLGILVADIGHVIQTFARRIPAPTIIGGGGIFDSIVIAAIIGVLLAELIGETRERLQGGPATERTVPPGLGKPGEEPEGRDSDE